MAQNGLLKSRAYNYLMGGCAMNVTIKTYLPSMKYCFIKVQDDKTVLLNTPSKHEFAYNINFIVSK